MKNWKDLTDQLSVLYSQGKQNGRQANRLKEELGIKDCELAKVNYTSAEEILKIPRSECQVGIWSLKATDSGHFFIRDNQYRDKWKNWANLHRFPVETKKKRLLLLGESVARGYYYDPVYTPAKVFQQKIDYAFGPDKIEVIDLAKTAITLKQLSLLYSECFTLKPDLIIIWAGNNWLFSVHDTLFDPLYCPLLEIDRDDPGAKVNKYLHYEMEPLILEFFELVAELSEKHKVPVVYILPEFNLFDWESSEEERMIQRLPEDRYIIWALAREHALLAREKNQSNQVALSADKMIQANDHHPLGYELLGHSYRTKGLFSEARNYMEVARDMCLVAGTNPKPRLTSWMRKSILKAIAMHPSIKVCDLPNIYASSNLIPDRDLFMDYCHHTSKGIDLVMNELINDISAMLKLPLNKSYLPEIKPTPKTEARAHMAAAVHNAHGGQPYDILYYHCRKALETTPSILRQFIEPYLEMAAKRIPSRLCAAHEKLLLNGAADQRYTLFDKKDSKILDISLCEAMMNACLDVSKVQLEDKVMALLQEEHALKKHGEKLNLLQSYYKATTFNEKRTQIASYYQAFDAESKFYIISQRGQDLSIDCTLRLSTRYKANETVTVMINNSELEKTLVNGDWKKLKLTLNDETLVDGINVLSFKWPVTSQAMLDTLRNDKPSRQKNHFLWLHPVAGEIHSLSASLATIKC